ncbi:MAG: hypothetical protein ACRD2S_08640, partial [Terriglobales bacterium]
MQKQLSYFVHIVLALVVTVVLGGALCAVVGLFVWHSRSRLIDLPYSPLLWGTAFLLAFVLNRRAPAPAASRVWIVGLAWLAILVIASILTYHADIYRVPLRQFLWGTFFSLDNRCMD